MRASTPRSRAQPTSPTQPASLTLDYLLADLPSAQHRAGLAGLVLLLKWLERLPGKKTGTARLLRLDDAGASVELDLEGLRRLFDELYAASLEEQKESQPRKDEPPLREEEVERQDDKGKARRKKYFIYEVPVPRAGLLLDLDPTAGGNSGHWVKLWRDMLWRTLRGVPQTRRPFTARARGLDNRDAEDTWTLLTRKKAAAVPLSSTDFLGAMDHNADGISFKESPRTWFLLHFWPYVTQVYVPRTLKVKDGRTHEEHAGFALAIPDVAQLQAFCEELPPALGARGVEVSGFRPREAVVDLAVESALMTSRLLRERLSRAEGARSFSALVLGYDVFHLDKEGNNVRTYSASRFEPDVEMVDAYQALQPLLWDPLFRRTRLLNLVGRRPWYAGFDRIAATTPYEATFGARAFRHDAWVSFERTATMDPSEAPKPEPGLEQLVLQVAGTYVRGKVKSKRGLDWESVKDDPQRKRDYEEAKERIARDAFLAVRSRTGQDFVTYFAGTLCSVPHHLKTEQFVRLSRALHERTEDVRTLTLLALSASA